MTDNWMTPEHQAAALAGIGDRVKAGFVTEQDLEADPLARSIALALDNPAYVSAPFTNRAALIAAAINLAGAVRMGLVERDLHLVPGRRLHELETLERDRAGQRVASVTTAKQPETLVLTDIHPANLAFYVRDLLDAAGYRYSPDGPLHGQVRECCELIADTRAMHDDLSVRIDAERERHATEVQRLEDLVAELRRHLEARDRDIQARNARIVELCAEAEAKA